MPSPKGEALGLTILLNLTHRQLGARPWGGTLGMWVAPLTSNHPLHTHTSTARDELRLSLRMLSSPGHTLGPSWPRLPHSRLQKPQPTLLPHRAPLPPFLPEAGLHSPGHWSLPFLSVVISNSQARLRLKQGQPLLITSVPYLHLICIPIYYLSKAQKWAQPQALCHTLPREGEVPGLLIPASYSQICTLV